MVITSFVSARVNSSRLPNKCLLPFGDTNVISHAIRRARVENACIPPCPVPPHQLARVRYRRGVGEPGDPQVAHRHAPGRRYVVVLGGLLHLRRLLLRIVRSCVELRPGDPAPVPGAAVVDGPPRPLYVPLGTTHRKDLAHTPCRRRRSAA